MKEQPTVSMQGTARIRQRPDWLVMLGSVRTAGPTLELALVDASQKSIATKEWLDRLEATDFEIGEPRIPDQVEPTAAAVIRPGKVKRPSKSNEAKKVVVAFAGRWAIDKMSSEENLILCDRLQFGAADLSYDSDEESDAPQSFMDDAQQQMQAIMSRLENRNADDNSVQFMFLSRLGTEARQQALVTALSVRLPKLLENN